MNYSYYGSPSRQSNQPLIGGAAYLHHLDPRRQSPTAFIELFRDPNYGANLSSSPTTRSPTKSDGPLHAPLNIRILCPKHQKFIVQICLHTNCKDRLLCQKCVNEHMSSHVPCFESPEEIFSSAKVDELKRFIHASDNKHFQAGAKHKDFLLTIDELFKEFYHMLEKYKADLKEYILDYSAPNIPPTMLVEIEDATAQFEGLQRQIISSQACDDATIEEFMGKFHKVAYLHKQAKQMVELEREIDYQTVIDYVKQMLNDGRDAMKIHLRKLDFDNLFDTLPLSNIRSNDRSPEKRSAEMTKIEEVGFGAGGGGGGGGGGFDPDFGKYDEYLYSTAKFPEIPAYFNNPKSLEPKSIYERQERKDNGGRPQAFAPLNRASQEVKRKQELYNYNPFLEDSRNSSSRLMRENRR